MRSTLIVLAALLALSGLSFSQTTFATITGTITDPSGLSLAGAKISSVQVETGYKLDVRSNETGVYVLPNLRAVNFVVEGLLGEGVGAQARFDPQAKALGEWLRARHVDIPEVLL